MAKRTKMNENEQSAMEEENVELKNKIMKLQEEKSELLSKFTDKLLQKTEECGDLKLKMKEMETKIEKLEKVKGCKEEPIISLDGGQRKISPGKDRKAISAMMEKSWSFQEIDKINCKLLSWMEEIVQIFRLPQPVVITPQQFMEYLSDGYMLFPLANILGNMNQINSCPIDAKKCYEYFLKFAKEEAKLAEGCVNLLL